jgi:diadenosine tetraphosphate (Ap4A) HIT family hydrolase
MKVVGEDIPHTHVHLIPFSTAAEFNSLPDMTTETDGVALAALAKKLAM